MHHAARLLLLATLAACGHEDDGGHDATLTTTDTTTADTTTATADPDGATTTDAPDSSTEDALPGDAAPDTFAGDVPDTTGPDVEPPTDTGPVVPTFGLDERPANTTCHAFARPDPGQGGEVALVPAFPNMDFQGRAIGLKRTRMGASGPLRWFVLDREGLVWTFVSADASKDGLGPGGAPVERAEVFLDLPETVYGTGGEGGLLGFAFDPDFGVRDDANDVYVHYTTWPSNNVRRFRVAREAAAWSIVEDELVFRTASGGGNHWGGDLTFGPDGWLYISLGDGGNGMTASDAQKTTWLRGKILRIDPRGDDGDAPYAIPPTNPFAGNPPCNDRDLAGNTVPCPEIFALGFRNPWRMNFDRDGGHLWVGDVGSGKEEVDLVLLGENYGWTSCDGVNPRQSCPPNATTSPFIAPVAQYRHYNSASVTGGFVYRGTALGTSLQGAYFFTDVYNGELLVIDAPYANVTFGPDFKVTNTLEHPDEDDAGGLPRFRKLDVAPVAAPVAWAEDEHAELYLVTFGSGRGQGVLKLVAPAPPAADPVPARLSDTGCVDPADPTKPAAGMIPYDLNAPFWSDGAEKSRWLALPDGAEVTIGADGDWDLPIGAVLMKQFVLDGQRIETRLMLRHADGGWAGYSYVWREDGSDADAASPEGELRQVGDAVWRYPSRPACMECHTIAAGGSLGLETAQLNRAITYPATGRSANQITTLDHIGVFAASPGDAAALPAFVAPHSDAPLGERARVYLHANCASCHRAGRAPDLKQWTELAATGLCANGRVVPGDPDASLVVRRMEHPDPTERMPRGAGTVIDQEGVQLVRDWITSLTACP